MPVARLDRSADRLLTAEIGMSYSRFRALSMVQQQGASTQRAWADRLGVTEPSASRMAAALAETGLIEIGQDPLGGNRRQLVTSPAGARLPRPDSNQ